jgi:GNAT superfamily N-acetyltransferase
MIEVRKAAADSPEAAELMRELSDILRRITGRGGEASFRVEDMEAPRSAFAIAYLDGKPAGCGAIREFSPDTAELKRMYAREAGRGVGKALLAFLEAEAARLAYSKIILETGTANENAVRFYLSNGYAVCENFGKYIGRNDSVCFHKMLE